MAEPFRIGINMAGAVSAGAYTAGVLDFLVEALDAWYAEREQWKYKDPSTWPIPSHDVSLEVLSGASAGGMCAAISAVALQEEFDHVRSIPPPLNAAVNRLYDCWVKRIDVEPLLGTADLEKDPNVVRSLLDCTRIEEIADLALRPQTTRQKTRPWVSKKLALYLTLTSLRGIPYSVDSSNNGSFEERILYYADEISFGFGVNPRDPQETKLALSYPPQPSDCWDQLGLAAMATGAFPGALAARQLSRKSSYYQNKTWAVSNPDPKAGGECKCQVEQHVPVDSGVTPAPPTIDIVYADGGVTNNNPFECARLHLVQLGGGNVNDHNPRGAETAAAAVVSVAPFPGTVSWAAEYNADSQSLLFRVLQSLIPVFLAQSRFQGESLSLVRDPNVHSRFVIAPSDDVSSSVASLLCGSLGAFGGFIDQKFRERDYQLGRRNCQRFLTVHFLLPRDNSTIGRGLIKADPQTQAQVDLFGCDPPPGVDTDRDKKWFPIIPLMPSARPEVTLPPRMNFKTTPERLAEVARLSTERVEAVVNALMDSPRPHPLAKAIFDVLAFFGRARVRDSIENFLTEQLQKSDQV
jgi:hypothetical protein